MEQMDAGRITKERAAELLAALAAGETASVSPEPARPSETPTPTGTPPPEAQYLEAKRFMLGLINEERRKVGVPPLVLGDNRAAQIHADSALAECYDGHWGSDGLKPYMRYSLAGGYQRNGENSLGLDYCVRSHHYVAENGPIKAEIRDAMALWMGSPGHRRAILDPNYRKVNIGLAWDQYNVRFYQHFEGDHVRYADLPIIGNGELRVKGTLVNGARVGNARDLDIQVYYDPPPTSLTRGQLGRTHGYDFGLRVASLREPLGPGWSWGEDSYTIEHLEPPVDPHDVAADTPAPSFSPVPAPRPLPIPESRTVRVPWITASEWLTNGSEFAVTANIASVLKQHGPGVYSVMVWAPVNGHEIPISEYSIFHEIPRPQGYDE